MMETNSKGKGIPSFRSKRVKEPSKAPNGGPERISVLSWEALSLFVSNLSEDASATELEAMLCRAGRVIHAFLPINQLTGKKQGLGFVRFKSEREALVAIELVNGRPWGGRRISVNFAHP